MKEIKRIAFITLVVFSLLLCEWGFCPEQACTGAPCFIYAAKFRLGPLPRSNGGGMGAGNQ